MVCFLEIGDALFLEVGAVRSVREGIPALARRLIQITQKIPFHAKGFFSFVILVLLFSHKYFSVSDFSTMNMEFLSKHFFFFFFLPPRNKKCLFLPSLPLCFGRPFFSASNLFPSSYSRHEPHLPSLRDACGIYLLRVKISSFIYHWYSLHFVVVFLISLFLPENYEFLFHSKVVGWKIKFDLSKWRSLTLFRKWIVPC